MADEIVCETLEEYLKACDKYGATAVYGAPTPAASATMGLVRIVYRPPPPRDEAREAFDSWAATVGYTTPGRLGAAWWTPFSDCDRLTRETAYRVFLAGRASVSK